MTHELKHFGVLGMRWGKRHVETASNLKRLLSKKKEDLTEEEIKAGKKALTAVLVTSGTIVLAISLSRNRKFVDFLSERIGNGANKALGIRPRVLTPEDLLDLAPNPNYRKRI